MPPVGDIGAVSSRSMHYSLINYQKHWTSHNVKPTFASPLKGKKDRMKHCFPRSLSAGNSGTTSPQKIKESSWRRREMKVKRVVDVVVSKSVPLQIGVCPGQCNSWWLVANYCWKPAFSLLDYLPWTVARLLKVAMLLTLCLQQWRQQWYQRETLRVGTLRK